MQLLLAAERCNFHHPFWSSASMIAPVVLLWRDDTTGFASFRCRGSSRATQGQFRAPRALQRVLHLAYVVQ